MARRKVVEEPENHERWLVSYADFITLLFAFFVVMYAISSVNEGKYRVLSDSLAVGFKGPPKSLAPIQVGSLVRSRSLAEPISLQRQSGGIQTLDPISEPVDKRMPPIPVPRELRKGASGEDSLERIHRSLTNPNNGLIDEEEMQIRRTEDWIEVELSQNMLFPDASAAMRPTAAPVVARIAELLRDHTNVIHVEGHADSRPIRTSVYPSNWELSAARAASVVSELMGKGIDASRLAAVGYGQYRPVADNATAEGQRRNRRVVIVVHSNGRQPRSLFSTDTGDSS